MDKEELKENGRQLVSDAVDFTQFDNQASVLFGCHKASGGGIRHSYWNAAISAVLKKLSEERSIPFGIREGVIKSIEMLKAK